jgi:hypothetical protein
MNLFLHEYLHTSSCLYGGGASASPSVAAYGLSLRERYISVPRMHAYSAWAGQVVVACMLTKLACG